MQIDELNSIIQASGGGGFALNYAEALLAKINRLEAANGYGALMTQLRAAKEQGDLRGRVLEVNFADAFAKHGVELAYGAKQGMTGDVDFCWNLSGLFVFIEMKLLREDKATMESIQQQLNGNGVSKVLITDDTYEIARIQRDIFIKSSIKKFNPKPEAEWTNLVAIDVSELQLGTVDICDCLLAVLGNAESSQYCHSSCLRPSIVGAFERAEMNSLQAEQVDWIKNFHKIPDTQPHPRDYIHGVLFLFRQPKDHAALSYDLSGTVVWNPAIIDEKNARQIADSLHQLIPCAGVAP